MRVGVKRGAAVEAGLGRFFGVYQCAPRYSRCGFHWADRLPSGRLARRLRMYMPAPARRGAAEPHPELQLHDIGFDGLRTRNRFEAACSSHD